MDWDWVPGQLCLDVMGADPRTIVAMAIRRDPNPALVTRGKPICTSNGTIGKSDLVVWIQRDFYWDAFPSIESQSRAWFPDPDPTCLPCGSRFACVGGGTLPLALDFCTGRRAVSELDSACGVPFAIKLVVKSRRKTKYCHPCLLINEKYQIFRS